MSSEMESGHVIRGEDEEEEEEDDDEEELSGRIVTGEDDEEEEEEEEEEEDDEPKESEKKAPPVSNKNAGKSEDIGSKKLGNKKQGSEDDSKITSKDNVEKVNSNDIENSRIKHPIVHEMRRRNKRLQTAISKCKQRVYGGASKGLSMTSKAIERTAPLLKGISVDMRIGNNQLEKLNETFESSLNCLGSLKPLKK